MKICNDRYVKMEDVAIQIERSIEYLKNKVFPQMVREGKLIKKYPYSQTHLEQAYKAVKEK